MLSSKNIKGIILVISLILILKSGYSQEFKGGAFIGLVSSQVDGDNYGGYNKPGFMAGGFVYRDLSNKWIGQLEIKFIQKGSREDDIAKGGTTYYKSVLNYIEIPVLAGRKMGKLTFMGGISGAYLFSSKEEDAGGEISTENTIAFYDLDVNILLGMNYKIFQKLSADFRFQYSLLPIRQNFSDKIQVVYFSDKYSFNNLLSFGLYYEF